MWASLFYFSFRNNVIIAKFIFSVCIYIIFSSSWTELYTHAKHLLFSMPIFLWMRKKTTHFLAFGMLLTMIGLLCTLRMHLCICEVNKEWIRNHSIRKWFLCWRIYRFGRILFLALTNRFSLLVHFLEVNWDTIGELHGCSYAHSLTCGKLKLF